MQNEKCRFNFSQHTYQHTVARSCKIRWSMLCISCHVSHSRCHGVVVLKSNLDFRPFAVYSTCTAVKLASVSEKDISERTSGFKETRHSSEATTFFRKRTKRPPWCLVILVILNSSRCLVIPSLTSHWLFTSLFFFILLPCSIMFYRLSSCFLFSVKGKMLNIRCRPAYMFCHHFHVLQGFHSFRFESPDAWQMKIWNVLNSRSTWPHGFSTIWW